MNYHSRRSGSLPMFATWQRSLASFTLVEVLVAMAVFLILLATVTWLMTQTAGLVTRDDNKASSQEDARQALDRFAVDWYARVRRSDVTWSITNDGITSGSMTFLSQVSAITGSRRLAAVSYFINAPTSVLERGNVGYNWSGSAPEMLFTNAPTSTVGPAIPADTDSETLAPTIFRICFTFLDSNTGTWSIDPPAGGINATNFGAIAVTVASLDQQSRKIVSKNQLQALATALGNVTGTNSPYRVWIQSVNSSGFASTSGVPASAASAVRIYQRYFYEQE